MLILKPCWKPSAPARINCAPRWPGCDETDLDLALDEGSWSIRQVAHHVVDGDALWKMGLLAALGSAPAFDFRWYWLVPQDEWAKHWATAVRPLEPALALFEANRQHTAQLLRAIPGALERQVLVDWPTTGLRPLSVREIIEMQTRHVAGHIADIQRTLRGQAKGI